MTPPTVAKSVLAGSGPRRRLHGSRTRLAWPRAVPGRTLTAAPSSSTLTPAKWRRTSTRMPSLWLCPFRLVPAERSTTGMPRSRPKRKSFATSPASRACTTARGNIRYGLASEAYLIRSSARGCRRPGPSSDSRSPRRGSGVPRAIQSGAGPVPGSVVSGAIRWTSGARRGIAPMRSKRAPSRARRPPRSARAVRTGWRTRAPTEARRCHLPSATARRTRRQSPRSRAPGDASRARR